MKLFVFTLITISLFNTSCTGFFETTETPVKTEEVMSKQQKAEEAVEDKILNSFAKLGRYKGFKYGELYTLKPKEIVELDQLFELRKVLPTLKENYPNNLDSVITANDTAIAIKKREIRTKKIFHTYELIHIFKITTESNTVKLYECKFILYPNYKVKDVSIILNTELNKKEDEMFYHFIMQYPLFENSNTMTANRLNNEAYTQFNKALENENKTALLKTILSICRYIRINNEFDETKISQMLVKEWILRNNDYSNSYKQISFSELHPISTTTLNEAKEEVQIPLGYKLIHKFEYKAKDNTLVDQSLQFNFDLNFVIINITEYTNDEK